MAEYRNGRHIVCDIKYHFVRIAKYRYKILRGKIAIRVREILKQGCEANGFVILKESVGPDHVHMLLSCPTDIAPSKIMQILNATGFQTVALSRVAPLGTVNVLIFLSPS